MVVVWWVQSTVSSFFVQFLFTYWNWTTEDHHIRWRTKNNNKNGRKKIVLFVNCEERKKKIEDEENTDHRPLEGILIHLRLNKYFILPHSVYLPLYVASLPSTYPHPVIINSQQHDNKNDIFITMKASFIDKR